MLSVNSELQAQTYLNKVWLCPGMNLDKLLDSISIHSEVLSRRLGTGLVPGQGRLGCLGRWPLPCRTPGRRWGPCP